MRKYVLLFSVLFLLVFSSLSISADKIQESSTDLWFKKIIKFSPEADSPELSCIGAGVRKKFIVKVYAGAIYIDSKAAAPVLGKYKPSTDVEDLEDYLEDLAEEEEFWNDFIAGSFHKAIVMRFVRDVGADKIVGAYEDGFEENLQDKSAKTKADVKTFLSFFKEEIKDGQDMTLKFAPDGTILVEYAGKDRGSIKNPAIAKSLLTNWFGEDPVSDDIKESGILHLFEVLK